MKNRTIGVLMGGMSSEREVSLRSGEAVLAALTQRGYRALPIYVDRDVDRVLRQSAIDVAFIALHGCYGEDGCIQGLLEVMGIPYTGSDVLASALAMHKAKAKELFRLHNLPTAPYYVSSGDPERALADHGDFGYPCVVKPVREGSSVGVTIVDGERALPAAIEAAGCFDGEVLVERFIAGQEVSVAVLGDRPLGAVEIAPKGEFYDFGAKYTRGADQLLPAAAAVARALSRGARPWRRARRGRAGLPRRDPGRPDRQRRPATSTCSRSTPSPA
jgi:D-alanine-D-alanine ligase